MNKLIPVTALFFFLFFISAKAQTWQWARNAGGIENDYANAIDADDSGNTYITGKFYNTIAFGSTILTNPGTWSVYIAKYDVNGNLDWAKIVACDSSINVSGICVDKTGELCIVGWYFGRGVFGTTNPVSLVSSGDYDVFVARYDSSGEIRWAKSAGGPGIDYGVAIGKDDQHNVYITGDFHINSFHLSASRIFVAKYDYNGNCSWLKTSLAYGNFHFGNGIKTDALGNSYITGQFFNSLVFDSSHVINAGNIEANIFIAKFDAAGNIDWGQTAGAASGYAGGEAIDLDGTGNAYVTGFYRGTISFGPLSLTGPSGLSYSAFVAKCDTGGNFIWANTALGSGTGRGISTDGAGGYYITGYFNDTITFGSTTLTNTGYSDIFIAKINSAGNFSWATQCGGQLAANIGGIKANSAGIFLTGNFVDTILFDSSLSLMANSSVKYDIFLAKLSSITGIEKEGSAFNEIILFPNPATNEIQFKGLSGESNYVIVDGSGKTVSAGNVDEAEKISVANLTKGIYFLRLTGKSKPGNTGRFKFMKN